MPSPSIEQSTSEAGEESVRRPAGIVERLVRDDVDRKRFLKMAGGTGAASFTRVRARRLRLQQQIVVHRQHGGGHCRRYDRLQQRRSGDPQLRAHARVPGDELL